MRPISIRFSGFGPYRTAQHVDFTVLEKSGVFLITGETGAGKTTILDAMCYALYGRSSGGIRGDLTAMRCKLAARDEETCVEFIFEVNARRYCFTRSLKYARKNINDSHNCMVLEGDTFVPLLENPKATYVNKKAEELIGLTYDQFRQVIILPQGQFEKLLVSDSAGKESILVSLFRAENWQRITDEMARRVAERDTKLKTAYAQWTAGLQVHGCETLTELEEKMSESEQALAAYRAEQQQQTAALAKHKDAYEKALVIYRDFEELQQRRTRLERLSAAAPQYQETKQRLQQADIAERIRAPFEAFEAAQNAYTRACVLCDEAKRVAASADAAHQQAIHARAAHEKNKPFYEQHKRSLTLYENARDTYRVLGEKQHAVHVLEQQSATHTKAHEAATAVFDAAHGAWLAAMNDQQEAITSYQTAQQQYLSSIGGVLAARLTAGEPCPVCGSTHHPAKAEAPKEAVSEAMLENDNQAVQRATDAVTAAAARRTQAEEALHSSAQTQAATTQALAVAKTALESALSQTIEGIDSLQSLEKAIVACYEAVTAYEKADVATAQALSESAGNAKAAALAYETATAACEKEQNALLAAEETWQAALCDTPFASIEEYKASSLSSEQRDERRVALVAYKTDCETAATMLAEQEEKVKGHTCPDMPSLQSQYEAANAAYQQLLAALTLAENNHQTLCRDAQTLASAKHTHDEQRERVDADLDFVRRLQGRTGVSLQRYVLGVMLSSITVAANRLLKNVHGGRYQLHRTDEIAGSSHKGGLELEVFDVHTGERRSVTTLSGGEKFLVSLSLAIGLSTVVQAQGSGVRIEAMFIDEGFGSLDRDSIADALEVLGSVHRGKGVVGIISHVEQLAETIPAKLVISKGKDGSHCRVMM